MIEENKPVLVMFCVELEEGTVNGAFLSTVEAVDGLCVEDQCIREGYFLVPRPGRDPIEYPFSGDSHDWSVVCLTPKQERELRQRHSDGTVFGTNLHQCRFVSWEEHEKIETEAGVGSSTRNRSTRRGTMITTPREMAEECMRICTSVVECDDLCPVTARRIRYQIQSLLMTLKEPKKQQESDLASEIVGLLRERAEGSKS